MTESELREPDEGDAMTAEAVTWERAIGVLVLALQQPPEAVAYALQAAARRHGLPLHALADAVETAAQGRRVQEPLPRKVWWEEWGDLLPLLDQLGAGRSARDPPLPPVRMCLLRGQPDDCQRSECGPDLPVPREGYRPPAGSVSPVRVSPNVNGPVCGCRRDLSSAYATIAAPAMR